MSVKLIDHNRDNTKQFDSRSEAEDKRNDLIALGANPDDLEIKEDDTNTPEVVAETEPVAEPEPPEEIEPEALAKNPIDFLRNIDSEFVNTIKGKPAISKQGFRFIQREFEISTQSKVVEVLDDPTGVIVWARAELPSGYSAEAHGEGYQFESDVRDNEFVRYADTRAKNRALSDLTSAGALAVSELKGGSDE